MFHSLLRRCRLPATALGLAVALLGCKGESGDLKAPDDPGTGPAARGTITVIVKMTGLLLIAPPPTHGGRTHVLVPTTRSVGRHVAWFGFVPGSQPPGLCALYIRRICYVDLKRWKVDSIGAGGRRTEAGGLLDPDFVNLTEAPGNPRANPDNPSVVARVTLLAGNAGPGCALAKWEFAPVSAPKVVRLMNVQPWVIQDVPGNSLKLVFRSRTSAREIEVDVHPVVNGWVELVLAHVPPAEVTDLPGFPGPPAPPVKPVDPLARHFHAFYDVLNSGHGQRPLPSYREPTPTGHVPCPLTVKTSAVRVEAGRGVRTNSCTTARADPA